MLGITSFVAALAAIALVGLSFAVSLRRIKVRTDLGTGEDVVLLRRIRAQGNFVEYVPVALILLGLVEYRGGGVSLLWTIAGLLGAGRLSHAVGMLSGFTPLRALGMMMTYASLLVAAGSLLR